MPQIPLPLNGPNYQSRNLKISAQETINFYPEIVTAGDAREQVAMQPLWGNRLWGAGGQGANRGYAVHADELYVVNGEGLYKYDNGGVATSLGTVSGSDEVGMASDRTNLIITNGSTPYNYTTSLNVLSDVDWNNAHTVIYFNDRFIFDTPTGYGMTDIGNPTNVNALNTTGGTSNPDLALGVYGLGNKFYPYGKKSIESWWNTGSGNPPAARETHTHKIGPIGRWAVDTNHNFAYMIASDKRFYRVQGVSMKPIGNPAIGKEVESYVTIDDCRVICATWDDNEYVIFSFPAANRSWLFHEGSDTWWRITSGVGLDRHAINGYVEVYGKKLIIDHANGNIYEMDFDYHLDNGQTMKWLRTTPPINAKTLGYPGKTLFFDSIEYTLKTGDASISGQGSNPLLMHRFSIDDGESWIEEMLPCGVRGNRTLKVSSYAGMGMIEPQQNLIVQMAMTDPQRWALVDATVGVEVSL